MKKLFTLIELIVVIVVLGILAAIVIPNISSFKEEAIKTEVVANTTNLQTVTDLYSLKNNGEVPTKAKPTIGNPTRIDLNELYPKYIRDKEFKHGFYWIDHTGKVWGSTIDAPRGLSYKDDTVSFEAVNDAVEYELFGYGEKGVQGAANGQSARSLENILVEKPLKIITKKLPMAKQSEGYLVSAVDKFGLPTAPVGKMYDGYDSIFPISQSFNLVTNAHGQATWLGLFVIEDKPAGTEINYTFETSDDGINYESAGSNILAANKSQYLKVKVEMKSFEGKYPTIHKLKVQFKLDGEEYSEADLIADRTHFEGVKDQLGDIILEDNVLEGRTEHVIEFPSENYFEEIQVIGEVPVGGSIDTSYQSSKDGINWSEEVLHPEELPAGKYIKVINEIKRDNKDIKSPTIEKIIAKQTDTNPNTGPTPPVVEEPIVEEEPAPEPEIEWESVFNINVIEDSTNVGDWISVVVTETKPAGTRIIYDYYTSGDESNWIKHETVAEAPNSRFFKVVVRYEREKGTTNTPQLEEMVINYKMQDGTTKSSIKYKDGVEVIPEQEALLNSPNSKITAGDGQTFVITENGDLWSFGLNQYGQLGHSTNSGTTTPTSIPVKVMEGVAFVDSGVDHTLVVKENGELWSFGLNQYGQLGRTANYTANPTPAKVMDNIKSVATGDKHSLVINENGELFSFGNNYYGQLGRSTYNGTNTATPIPTKVMDEAVSVSAGIEYTLVLKENGDVMSFGNNYNGTLGHADNFGIKRAHPVPRKILGQASFIDAGPYHAFVIGGSGDLWGFGGASYGRLGYEVTGTNVQSKVPIKVMEQVSSVSAGGHHTMVVKTNGELWSFGYNYYGQLGHTATASTNLPIKIMDQVSYAASGLEHTIVVKQNGEHWSFGRNHVGQLGFTANTLRNANPVKINIGN